MIFELVIYEPTQSKPVRVQRPRARDDDEGWRMRLRDHLAAGHALAIDLSEWGLGAVHEEAEAVKKIRSAPPDRSAIVGRWSLVEGADLLFTARAVRSEGRRVIRSLCDVVVDRRGPRVAWRVRDTDCRLLASYGLLTRVRGTYRHTPIGLGVRAVLLGGTTEIAPKILENSACDPL